MLHCLQGTARLSSYLTKTKTFYRVSLCYTVYRARQDCHHIWPKQNHSTEFHCVTLFTGLGKTDIDRIWPTQNILQSFIVLHCLQGTARLSSYLTKTKTFYWVSLCYTVYRARQDCHRIWPKKKHFIEFHSVTLFTGHGKTVIVSDQHKTFYRVPLCYTVYRARQDCHHIWPKQNILLSFIVLLCLQGTARLSSYLTET